jgi:hypothetical protein
MSDKDEKVQPGMDTEAIITLLKLQSPPERHEGEGINVPEYAKALRKSKDRARKELSEREDLLPVLMTGYNGRETIVFMPIEDAKNKYPDWIIES